MPYDPRVRFTDVISKVNLGFIVRIPYENAALFADSVESLLPRFGATFIYAKTSGAKLRLTEASPEEIIP